MTMKPAHEPIMLELITCRFDLVATEQDQPDKIKTFWHCKKCKLERAITYDVSECATCNTRGGTLEFDSDGEGVWSMQVTYFVPCDDCLSNGLCPGCSNATLGEGVFQAAMSNIDTFTCPICGWHYDGERFYDSEPDYWPDTSNDGYDDQPPDEPFEFFNNIS